MWGDVLYVSTIPLNPVKRVRLAHGGRFTDVRLGLSPADGALRSANPSPFRSPNSKTTEGGGPSRDEGRTEEGKVIPIVLKGIDSAGKGGRNPGTGGRPCHLPSQSLNLELLNDPRGLSSLPSSRGTTNTNTLVPEVDFDFPLNRYPWSTVHKLQNL